LRSPLGIERREENGDDVIMKWIIGFDQPTGYLYPTGVYRKFRRGAGTSDDLRKFK
jgi:hypothetical protein